MTVALLAVWGGQPPGTLYTTDSVTEAAMVTAKVATTNLAGAVAWVPPGGSSTPGAALSAAQQGAVQALLTPSLANLPFVASGLLLPTTGGLLANVGAGDAFINGLRFIVPATPIYLTASKDNYIDLTYNQVSLQGYYVVQPVTIGAAAPAVPTNGIRIGFVTTGASTITGATQTGKDSLGNWMSNVVAKPVCSLYVGSGQSYFASSPANVIFGVGTEVYDNDFMHSVSSNNTRITLNKPGLYSIRGGFTTPSGVSGVVGTAIFKNGSQVTNQLQGLATYGVNGTWICSMTSLCAAGDYLELNVNPVANGFNLLSGFIEVVRQ